MKASILSLVEAAETVRAQQGRWPEHSDELYAAWLELHPGEQEPQDPYSGDRYAYKLDQDQYLVWSVGPDATDESDDLYYASPVPVAGAGDQ
jgi:hypothetical protein